MNNKKEEWMTVEFHCHTVFSPDSSSRIPDLIAAARARGIDLLAITDHNTIAGALVAKALAPELIIVGEEILTQKGELLAYFLTEEIPPRLSAEETIARLQAQGAFIAVPHPFDRHRHGWELADLLRILPQIDAIEVFNARSFQRSFNDQALFFTREHDMPAIAGSDAHGLVELGYARTLLPSFTDAESLRRVVSRSVIQARRLSSWVHIKSNMTVAWGRLAGNRRKKEESA